MKRIVVVALLATLAAGLCLPVEAQDAGPSKSERQTEKSAQQQQKALYMYQKKQEKAQQKAQRKADKQQRKAAINYDKQQRKMLKTATPSKHAA
jgi:hypothetical protein